MKQTLLFFLSTLIALGLAAQTTDRLFKPLEIKKAYAKGTRDKEGYPGADYWQNSVSYDIKAELFPKERRVDGTETIVYTNKSPDTLSRIVFNLYQNIYKKGGARDWDIGPEDITKGVHIKQLKINGVSYPLNGDKVRFYATTLSVKLDDGLLPYGTANILLTWSVTLPAKRTIRMGTYGQNNFMVGYWFPSVAVYDDIRGWDNIPYTGSCEFYNEFANFDVEITAPADYVLMATGALKNAQDIFTPAIIDRMNRAYTSKHPVHVLTEEDRRLHNYLKPGDKHHWKFKAHRVSDFAFAASNEYLWDATSVKSGPHRVHINAFYKKGADGYDQVTSIAARAIDFYTNKAPKMAFPFLQLTVFNGNGAMEFPAMVNMGNIKKHNELLYTLAHEIFHAYFPFQAGTNEELYAWMDEGLASLIPRLFVAEHTTDKDYHPFAPLIENYRQYAPTFYNMPLIVPSVNTGLAYRYQAYTHAGMTFYQLYQYLGADNFFYNLRLFMGRWKGKHPTPYDLFYTFNQGSHQDLGWFWDPWVFRITYADLALKNTGHNIFKIVNKSGVPVPVMLTITYDDGSTQLYSKPASIWKGNRNAITLKFNIQQVQKMALDTTLVPDAYPADNVVYME